ncbi:MAG: lipocalin-like domain-containing protein [Planctomycetota bacterium]
MRTVELLRATALVVLALASSGASVQDGYDVVRRGVELAYPRDHGAHPGHRTEWWYVTGQVEDASGRVFGYQFTIFRVAIAPPLLATERSKQVYAGHFAVADVEGRDFRVAERLRRGGTPLARASVEDLDVVLEDWRVVRAASGELVVEAGDVAEGIAIAFELRPEKELVLHGEDGWSQKGPGETNASAYASFTRLASRGTLSIDGERREVSGTSWFDHEYGTSQLGEGVVGWDWCGLHLDDGRDLMCYVLRREDGTLDPRSSGTLVDADGAARHLTSSDFEFESSGTFTSARTGATYPDRFRIVVPSASLDLRLVPRLADCELTTGASTRVSYWEGPVQVSGSAGGGGYLELTGYAGTLEGRF